MARHNITGNKGEKLAAEFLEKKGYNIKEKNYRYKRAEIDIIAQKENLLIFFEVKTRGAISFGLPEEFVDAKKRDLIIEAADQYIFDNNWQGDIRFDIISVVVHPQPEITQFEDAFY
ncbi:YraN family protein [soil metagenome]